VADEEHLKIIRQGVAAWNAWREENPKLIPDLRGADLRWANLTGANLTEADFLEAILSKADLTKADLRGADLHRASLWEANLSGADLRGANLSGAQLIGTDLRDATLTGSRVYGVSVWDIKVDDLTNQQNLVITPDDEVAITVDNIKVAQFIHLLLTNKEIRDVIDTITSKAVLILGRFTPPEHKEVLDALHTALRNRGFVPITFDFERPTNKDFSETIMTLAGMSCFIIADITNPKSSPLELQATVPNYMVPFVPIIQQGEKPFAMFSDLHHKYDWVLPPLFYHSSESLVARLKNAIIEPALEMRRKLALIKAQELPTRNVSDYPEDE
jgi:Pentapeptide repeats (8 copies)